MNRYPLWKYVLIGIVLLFGALYSIPNLFEVEPSLQVTSSSGLDVTSVLEDTIAETLRQENIDVKSITSDTSKVTVIVPDSANQKRAGEVLQASLDQRQNTVALTQTPDVPGFFRAIKANPMVLGLDLRGGVHFLMEVDMPTAERQQREAIVDDIRSSLRDQRIRYQSVVANGRTVTAVLRDAANLSDAVNEIRQQNPEISVSTETRGEEGIIRATITDTMVQTLRQSAMQQNLTTLRNRINQSGVAEPSIQQQGEDRIVIQLPGVDNPTEIKKRINATATLEYRAVDMENDAIAAANSGRIPPTSRLYFERDGTPVLLQKRLIVSGKQLIGASAGFDPQNGSPMVRVTLDGSGANRMFDFTKENVNKLMAVVYIEQRYDPETDRYNQHEEVISVANIIEPFSKTFQTTGLDSFQEASDLALFLRAGALAAPIRIIEERTVGPSLGQDNIDRGFRSVVIGFILVLIFMAIYYRVFGLIANVALFLNLILLVAALSMFGATLTLPGIAGIVLTVGMAVDANVLIFERIREELRNGNSPQNSIRAGYDKALSTIADANITTLIAALALLAFGSGPIRGFAVTLSIGIVTSMFTAIMVTRALVNWFYGRKAKLKALAI